MGTFKRLEKRASQRMKSDRDSGYEDLSPVSRASCSFEDVLVTPLPPSFTDWSIPARMPEPGKINADIFTRTTSTRRRFVDENRKREVEAGKIGISHMLRQLDSATRIKELPNLKPEIKSSAILLGEQIPSRKPRGKRRSKSADGRPARQISMFNPIYTKILSPRELQERTKWAEKLRIDAILDEEYYKLPYEEINKEIALGRYSRSEPRLNWKRKHRKRVSFSTDIEQKEEKRSEVKSVEGDYNWKEDSGFHEIDIQPAKSIVKYGHMQYDNFDDSNVFSDEPSSSDSHYTDSNDEYEENATTSPLESELQGLCHLIKAQEERAPNIELREKANPKAQSKYITELVLNLNSPPIPKTKVRKIFPSDLKRNADTGDKFSTQLTNHVSTQPADARDVHQKTTETEAQLPMMMSNDVISDNGRMLEEKESSSKSYQDLKRVTAIIHTAVDASEKTSDKLRFDAGIDDANCINKTSSGSRNNDISAEILRSNGIVKSKVESERDLTRKEETAAKSIPANKEEIRNNFFEITPPVKTLPDVRWHRDFIDYSEQSPLKQLSEERGNQPLTVKPLIANVGGRIKIPLNPSDFSKTNSRIQIPPVTEKSVRNPVSVQKSSLANSGTQQLSDNTHQSSPIDDPSGKPNPFKIDTIDKNIKALNKSGKNEIAHRDIGLLSNAPKSPKNNIILDQAKINSSRSKSEQNQNDAVTPPTLKKEVLCRNKLVNGIIENDQKRHYEDGLRTEQLINVMGKEKLKFLNILESDEDESAENNNNIIDKIIKEPLIIEQYTIAKPCKAVPVLVNKFGHVTDIDAITGKENIKNLKQNNAGAHLVSSIEELDITKDIKNINQNSHCNPDVNKIIKNKLIIEDDFYCETDTSDEAMLTEIQEGIEADNEEDISASVAKINTSFDIKQESHKESIPPFDEANPSMNDQLHYKDGKLITINENGIVAEKLPLKKNSGVSSSSGIHFAADTSKDKIRSKHIERENSETKKSTALIPTVNNVPSNEEQIISDSKKSSEDIVPRNNSINPKLISINGNSERLPPSSVPKTPPLVSSKKSRTVTPESTESESSEEDSSDSSTDSNASYNIEQETHEVSIKDSPNEAKCSVNEHHEYFKEEGQAAKSIDTDSATVKSIVRRKVEETVTDIVNVTSVITPDGRKTSNGSMENGKIKHPSTRNVTNNNQESKTVESKVNRLRPETVDTCSKLTNSQLGENTHNSKILHQSPTSPKTPPFALPRKSLFDGMTDKNEHKKDTISNHNIKTKEKNNALRRTNVPVINKNNQKKMDNMAKIKEAFIKAGLNPKVFDDLDDFDKQNTLSPTDFRENFVNMFLTKELSFTDYNIHLRTRANSTVPNRTVTRKFLPLSMINEQMTWLRQTPAEKPVYTCHIASSNENIHKAALSLSKASRSGTNSPEELYEYNTDRDESPIDNQTTSPTPSWAESSSSGCFSASCSPTPHPTAAVRPVPMPTSL